MVLIIILLVSVVIIGSIVVVGFVAHKEEKEKNDNT